MRLLWEASKNSSVRALGGTGSQSTPPPGSFPEARGPGGVAGAARGFPKAVQSWAGGHWAGPN